MEVELSRWQTSLLRRVFFRGWASNAPTSAKYRLAPRSGIGGTDLELLQKAVANLNRQCSLPTLKGLKTSKIGTGAGFDSQSGAPNYRRNYEEVRFNFRNLHYVDVGTARCQQCCELSPAV